MELNPDQPAAAARPDEAGSYSSGSADLAPPATAPAPAGDIDAIGAGFSNDGEGAVPMPPVAQQEDAGFAASGEWAPESAAPAQDEVGAPADEASGGWVAAEMLEALPEAPAHLPPRPLTPGAFLRGEFEIKSVLARGTTNLYIAAAGDYGEVTPCLIAEREPADAPDVAGTPAAELPPGELFPESEAFAQDGREYRVYAFAETQPLQDYREPMNDARLLTMLGALARGVAALDGAGLCAELDTELLRVNDGGALHFYGFASPAVAPSDGLAQLRAATSFLMKHVFAESSTMRLDDRFAGLALCDEVKALARRIDEDAPQPFATAAEAGAAIDALFVPGRRTAVDAALLSDVGQERELNEDAALIACLQRAAHLGSCAIELYVVSDGMGGHEGGEVASDLTLTALLRGVQSLSIDWDDNIAVRAALVDVIDAVNGEVVALTEAPRYRGTRAKPGATLTFALRLGARVFVGNVGDSRTYKYSARGLERVTKDHSYVQGLIDRGELTEEEAWDHPEGSIITAHIGYAKLKTRDVFLRLLAPGDKLLLVSDGVVDMLRDRTIEAALSEAVTAGEDSAAICRRLVDASNAAGGFDNITALCVSFL